MQARAPPSPTFWLRHEGDQHNFNTTFICYKTVEEQEPGTELTLANSYGGIPALFAFHSCNMLIALSLFCLSWGLCGRTVVTQQLGRKRFESINLSDTYPHIPRHWPKKKNPPTFGDAWFYLRRDELLSIYGEDALAYLHFQRYMILMLAIITVCVIVVLMPINIIKGKHHMLGVYENGTIDNLRGASNYHFAHMCVSFCCLPLSMLVMSRFLRRVVVRHRYEHNPRALWMRNLPSEMRTMRGITEYFDAKYPNHGQILDVYFTHNIVTLEKLCARRLFVKKTLSCTGSRTNLFRTICKKHCFIMCRGSERARPFYQLKFDVLNNSVRQEKLELGRKSRLATVFVVFEKDVEDLRVYESCEATKEKTFKIAAAPPVDGELLRTTCSYER